MTPTTHPTTPTCSTPTPVSRGFVLPCPKCGNAESCISLHLDDCETFTCRECDEEFTADDVRDLIAKWGKVLAWIDAATTIG
jgi:uncharacterized protein (DUF983 family)